MPTVHQLVEILQEVRHAIDDFIVVPFAIVGIWVAVRHGLEFAKDYVVRLRDKDDPHRVRSTIIKDMMNEAGSKTVKLRRLRVAKTVKELNLDPWPNIIDERDRRKPAKLTHVYSVPGRLGTREDEDKKEFRLLLGRDEELKKHREYSTLLAYTLDNPLAEILTPPSFLAKQPLGKEFCTYEVHFPVDRKFVRNKDLDDPNSKDEPRIKVYNRVDSKDHELTYEAYGWNGSVGWSQRQWIKVRNRFRARYHVIGGRTDFNDGSGEHDWFRVTVLKPPKKGDIHICWCMQEDPISKWKWCKHTAGDHRKDDDALIASARATFQKLAVFEVDAKKSASARLNWEKNRYLLEATDQIDKLFWQQTLQDGDYQSLLEDVGDDEELKEMVAFNRGPYDRFNANQPFLNVEPEPTGKAFYPPDLSRQEFTEYVHRHPEAELSFESPYTVIRRNGSDLTAVPYHEAYGGLIKALCDRLRQASMLERHEGFRQFLAQREKDLLTDDYYASEVLWVALEDNPIDLVMGPYEVYEDDLMGLKAAYEAIMFERDFEESAKIAHIQRELLPMCEKLEKEFGRSLPVQNSRIKLSVANLIYAGGEARKSIPAIAFSLPNDERVIEEVGSRQVILKNVMRAKFKLIAQPISNRVLKKPINNEKRAFRDFFTHTLFHEISHSLGPQRIVVGGEKTTVNRRLKQYHSLLEEAKADTLGACFALITQKESDANTFLRGYAGRLVRSSRFGQNEAHGGANILQLNYLLREGAVTVDLKTVKISVDIARTREAIFKLAVAIMDIQERGDFAEARNTVTRYAHVTPEIRAVAESIQDLPTDIRIRYLDWVS